uniref:Uncharacterized protein n=1 Tax=uncultured Vibrionales bacterium HF0010_22E23 TaxID=710999 RepID=E0XRG0_9GAMM|nr:hypothetical protein [uncultured Vibrionales bacterium HF0010_22E23]
MLCLHSPTSFYCLNGYKKAPGPFGCGGCLQFFVYRLPEPAPRGITTTIIEIIITRARFRCFIEIESTFGCFAFLYCNNYHRHRSHDK